LFKKAQNAKKKHKRQQQFLLDIVNIYQFLLG